MDDAELDDAREAEVVGADAEEDGVDLVVLGQLGEAIDLGRLRLVVSRRFDPAVGMEGDLSVCFGDSDRSCVSGSFSAVPCASPLDETPRAFGAVSKEEIAAIKARLADAGYDSGASGADAGDGAAHDSGSMPK